MKRLFCLYCLLGFLLIACGASTSEAIPTPLPTAVPPDNQSPFGDWAISFQHEFPSGFWAEGVHRYGYRLQCPPEVWETEDFGSEWREFQVTTGLDPQIAETVAYFRLNGISRQPFAPVATEPFVHPEQPTVGIIHLLGMTQENAELAATDCEVLFGWDLGAFVKMTALEPFKQ